MDIRYFEGETGIGPFRRDIFATPIFVGHTKTDIAQRAEKLALKFRDQTNGREGLVGEKWSKGATSEDKKTLINMVSLLFIQEILSEKKSGKTLKQN